MKIESLGATVPSQGVEAQSASGGGPSFKEFLNKSSGWEAPQVADVFNRAVTPKELLFYQVQTSAFNLRIELVSKAAESVSATIKRFQNS